MTQRTMNVPVKLDNDVDHRFRLATAINNILQGKTNNTGTVTLTANASTTTLSDIRIGKDSVILLQPTTQNAAKDIASDSNTRDKIFAFLSPSGSTGTSYFGGYYDHSATASDFSGSPTFGTANASNAGHFFVVLGAATVDILTLTVTGTSITDAGVRTASDTENIVIPASTAVNSYFETTKKWLGQITISVASGTAKICDYGMAEHWDDDSREFHVHSLYCSWLGGANDTAPNIELLHHKSTGWTYTGTGATPTTIASMNTDHVTEIQTVNGESGSWRHSGINTTIDGANGEGIIIAVTNSANKAFALGNAELTIHRHNTELYFDAPTDGSVVINHDNNANTDRTFNYVIVG